MTRGAAAIERRRALHDHHVLDAVDAMLDRSAAPDQASPPQPFVARRSPFASRDPATAVEWMRAGPHMSLPYHAELRQFFGRQLDGIEVHRDDRAAEACKLLDARAFTVGNIVAFADRSPPMSRVAHEITHVLQQAAAAPARFAPGSLSLSDPASRHERQAASVARGARPTTLAHAPLRVYREQDTDPDLFTKQFEKRLYQAMQSNELALADHTEDTSPVGVPQAKWYQTFKRASKKPWKKEDYRKATGATDDQAEGDLRDAFKPAWDGSVAKAGYVINTERIRLARVADPGAKQHTAYSFAGADPEPSEVGRVEDIRIDQRIKAFVNESDWKIADTVPAVFGVRKKGERKPSVEMLRSSKQPFQLDDYIKFLKAAGRVTGDEPVTKDLQYAVKNDVASRRGFPIPTGAAYIVPVVEPDDEDFKKAFYYALLEEPRSEIQFADKSRIKEQKSPEKVLKAYLKTFIGGLIDILETGGELKGKAIKLDQQQELLDEIKRIRDVIEAALKAASDAKLDPTVTVPDLVQTSETARHKFVEAIVTYYDDVAALHQHLGNSKLWNAKLDLGGAKPEQVVFEKIRGTCWEDWVAKRYPLVKADPQHVPVFGKLEGGKLGKSDLLQKVRRGDGKILTKDKKQVIFEAKFVTAAPTDEHISQMQDYAVILGWDPVKKQKTTPLTGYFYDPAEQKWVTAGTWEYVVYTFTTKEQHDAWMNDLNTNLDHKWKGYYPGGDESLLTGFDENPVIQIKIKDATKLEHNFPPFDEPAPKQPGIEFKSVYIKLAGERDPTIEKGRVVTAVDLKGVVKSEDGKPPERVIEPLSESERIDQIGATGAKKPRVFGHVREKMKGLKSKLDDLLRRVKISARLVEGGVEASADIEPGESGIPRFKLTKGNLTVTLARSVPGGFKVDGSLGLAHESGKIEGGVTIGWGKKGLTIEGSAKVKDLIEGLKPFDLSIKYTPAGEEEGSRPIIDIAAKNIEFGKKYKGVEITGKADLKYSSESGKFSGNGNLTADLGSFGKASAENITVVDDKVKKATFTYESPSIAWPKKNPTLTIGMKGTADYEDGKFSGGVDVAAKLTHKNLKKLNPNLESISALGRIEIGADGSLSGSIETTSKIPLGKHFEIASFKAQITPEGEWKSNFTVDLVNIETSWVKLDEARVTCAVDRDGFRVLSGKITATIGRPGAKFSGQLTAAYDPDAGFTLGGWLDYEVKKGLVVHGTFNYVARTQAITVVLTLKQPLVLLDTSKSHELLNLTKQIRIFGVPFVIGLYLELGVVLNFNYGFKLTILPVVKLTNFSLATFKFDEAVAMVTLGGEIYAELVPTPKLGLGGYLIDPIVLRGGGGIEIPISAKARLLPRGDFEVRYSPDGGVKAGATIGLSLRFGISARVRPYASFVVLDGVYAAEWKGEGTDPFVILPERELFSYEINFGAPLEKNDDPKMPPKGEGPATKPVTKGLETQREGNKEAEKEKQADKPGVDPSSVKDEPAGDQEGFSLKSVVDKLKELPTAKKIIDILETVKEAYEFIKGILGKIWRAIKQFIGDTIDMFLSLLKGVAENGLFKYIKQLLKQYLNETLFWVIEPVLDEFIKEEDALLDMFQNMPKDPLGMIWHVIKSLFGITISSLSGLVSAIKKMFGRGKQAIGRWLNHLVKTKRLGVLRHGYYVGSKTLGLTYDFQAPDQYKVHIGGFRDHDRQTGRTLVDPAAAVAYPLHAVLWLFDEVDQTENSDAESDGNYWYGSQWEEEAE